MPGSLVAKTLGTRIAKSIEDQSACYYYTNHFRYDVEIDEGSSGLPVTFTHQLFSMARLPGNAIYVVDGLRAVWVDTFASGARAGEGRLAAVDRKGDGVIVAVPSPMNSNPLSADERLMTLTFART
jgi:hypothetical protein